jgi:hypothetical protein
VIDVPGSTTKGLDYRYFGAVKFLPGIKELFEKPLKEKKRRSSDPDYFRNEMKAEKLQ